MSKLEQLQRWPPPVSVRGALRRLAASLLERGSRTLARLAARLVSEPVVDRGESVLEFHAEAGAPEGALYVDGKLVGWISGVRRL